MAMATHVSILVDLALKYQIQIYSFDSSQGIPNPSSEDESARNPKRGDWARRTVEEARMQLVDFGLPENFVNHDVIFVPGFVEKTLREIRTPPLRLLHLDLDLYSGYKSALERLYEYVVDSGVIRFDEYGELKWPGQQRQSMNSARITL